MSKWRHMVTNKISHELSMNQNLQNSFTSTFVYENKNFDHTAPLSNMSCVARVQAQGKNSGPSSKARYFVVSAFANERGILIGCLLLDSL